MLTLSDVQRIPFPNPDELDWMYWPINIDAPDGVSFKYSDDMVQLCAILKKDDIKYLVCNADNEIGFLQDVIEALFPENMIWYDIRQAFGVSDFFWYSHSIECGDTKNTDLPEWCQEVMQVLLDAHIIECIGESGKPGYFYYVEDYENILKRDLKPIYTKFKTIFLDAAQQYYTMDYSDNDAEEELDYARNTIADNINMLLKGYS